MQMSNSQYDQYARNTTSFFDLDKEETFNSEAKKISDEYFNKLQKKMKKGQNLPGLSSSRRSQKLKTEGSVKDSHY